MFSSNKTEIREIYKYNKNIKKEDRIVFISDIHISKYIKEKDIDFIIKSIKSTKSNKICILGDIIDYPSIIKDKNIYNIIFKLFEELSKIGTVYYILGNHDFINYKNNNKNKINYNKEFWNKIDKINNIYNLNNKYIKLDNINLYGYFENYKIYEEGKDKEFYKDFKKRKELKVRDKNNTNILIMHSPNIFNNKLNIDLVKDYDFIICGHNHNGCTPPLLSKIKSNRGIVSPSKKLFASNMRGIRKLNNNYLIYSGGWTKISSTAPKIIHFLDKICYRQIDLIILTNDKKLDNCVKFRKINK